MDRFSISPTNRPPIHSSLSIIHINSSPSTTIPMRIHSKSNKRHRKLRNYQIPKSSSLSILSNTIKSYVLLRLALSSPLTPTLILMLKHKIKTELQLPHFHPLNNIFMLSPKIALLFSLIWSLILLTKSPLIKINKLFPMIPDSLGGRMETSSFSISKPRMEENVLPEIK